MSRKVNLGPVIGPTGAAGFSPIVTITKDGIVNTLTIEDINGLHSTEILDGKDGIDGEPGTPGKDGVNGTDGKDGEPGEDGVDGFSPIVDITKVDNVSTIRITDSTGTKSTQLIDGKDGANGADGKDGADGRDGYVQYTAGDNITIDENNIISAAGGTSVTLDDIVTETSENGVKSSGIYTAISASKSELTDYIDTSIENTLGDINGILATLTEVSE